MKSPVPSIPVPGRRFSHFYLDLVGPLPLSQGYNYILTLIYRTLRWPEAIPLSSITAESCARAFISTWVSRFGVPALLTSDRGAQFTSSIWSEVCSVLGISCIQTTSFHPSELWYDPKVSSIPEVRLKSQDGWFRLGLSSTSGDAWSPDCSQGRLRFSSAEAVSGANLSLPGEFIKHSEFPSEVFLRKVERAISGYSRPPRHHVVLPQPQPLP